MSKSRDDYQAAADAWCQAEEDFHAAREAHRAVSGTPAEHDALAARGKASDAYDAATAVLVQFEISPGIAKPEYR